MEKGKFIARRMRKASWKKKAPIKAVFVHVPSLDLELSKGRSVSHILVSPASSFHQAEPSQVSSE